VYSFEKEGIWGKGIFARPLFFADSEFRASETAAPQFYFPDLDGTM